MATDVILRYGSNRTDLQIDIDHADHVRELSEEYVFRAVSLWLVTTYGSLVCPTVIQTELDDAPLLLARTFSEFNEYPFANLVPDQSFEDFNEGAEKLLNGLSAEIEMLGSLYEHIHKFPAHIDNDGTVDIPTHIQDRDKRRLVGQFYTPSAIVDYCYERAFDALKDKFIIALKSSDQIVQGGDSAPVLARESKFPRILDPACGTGNFLLGAIRLARTKLEKNDPAEVLSYISESIFGFEVDGRAACLARLSLILASVDLWCADKSGLTLRNLLISLRRNIKNTDTLYEAPNSQALNSLALNSQAPNSQALNNNALYGNAPNYDASNDAEAAENSRFEIVITNPPYVSFGARNQPKLNASANEYLRTKFPNSAEYKIRVHSIFQEIALRYTMPDGIATLLVPDGFLTGGYYRNLRQMLLSESRLDSLTELPVDTVPGAVVGRWCVATYVRNSYVRTKNLRTKDLGVHALRTKDEGVHETPNYPVNLFSYMQKPPVKYEISSALLVSKDQCRFRLIFNDIDMRLTALLDSLQPLSSEFNGHAGIRALNGQNSIISYTPDKPSYRKAIVTGISVQPHVVTWNGAWLNIDAKLLWKGGFNPDIVERPKLLIRQTGDCVISALDDQNYYHLNNVHSLTRKSHSPRDLDFLDGLMNSQFWKYVYRLKTREEGRALAQIDIDILKSMPLPNHDALLESQIAALTRMFRLAHKQTRTVLCGDIQRAIDALVYKMFDLDQPTMQQIEHCCGTLNDSSVSHQTAEKLLTLLDSLQTDEVLCGFQSR